MSLAALLCAALLTAGASHPDGPILLLPVDGPEGSALALEAELTRAIRARLGEGAIVSHGEIDVALTAERTKDLIGCDDVACLNDLLGALGGRWALGVTLTAGEPLSSVVVILRDLEDATRAFRVERSAPSLNPARLRDLASDLATAVLHAAGWSALDEAPVSRRGSSGGTLRISSNPEGATVVLNGNPIGESPLALSGLTAGDYKLRLRAFGFHDRKQRIALAAGSERILDIDLVELRDWQAGAYGGVVLREADAVANGGALRGTAAFLEAGAWYSREVWGPVQVGGLMGYSALDFSDSSGAGLVGATHNGFAVGAHVSFGGCLCLSALTEFSAAYGEGQQAIAAQAWLDNSEQDADFALASGRLRAKLVARTPGYLTAEIGAELGMLGIFHFDIFWAPILIGKTVALDTGGVQVMNLDRSAVGMRMIVGYSAFYRGP